MFEHRLLGAGAHPRYPAVDAERPGVALQPAPERPAADMDEAPMQIIRQTGKNAETRAAFLQGVYNEAKTKLLHTWEPLIKADPTF